MDAGRHEEGDPPPPSLPRRPEDPAEGSLRYEVPGEWVSERPRSNLRKAQYRVPDKDGQEQAAELVVFHFGPDAGSLEQNLERARSQISPDDESGEPDEASFEAGGLRVSTLDAQGTYSDQLSGESRPDSRMLWAYVATPAGPYFFKLVGPRGTVSDWAAEFGSMLRSVRFDAR
jgi:hypothetical protein